jgi:hypothetical protein
MCTPPIDARKFCIILKRHCNKNPCPCLHARASEREGYFSKPTGRVELRPAAPGISSGDTIAIMDRLCAEQLLANIESFPEASPHFAEKSRSDGLRAKPAVRYEWTELTLQEIIASKDLLAKLVFPLAVLFVLMVLAAQYESWSLPFAILLIVPMCIFAAVAGIWLVGIDINIFARM